jgi:hypothetical protein
MLLPRWRLLFNDQLGQGSHDEDLAWDRCMDIRCEGLSGSEGIDFRCIS